MPTPTYTPLATVTLGSSASSVTFSSIPATYRDLILVFTGASASGSRQAMYLQMNNSTANRTAVEMLGAPSNAAESYTHTNGQINYYVVTNLATSIIQIFDYSATDKHKTALIRNGSSSNDVSAYAHRWGDTSAVTSVRLNLDTSFAAGSTFNLFGVIS
jgi:hypothetical protein